MKFENTFLKYSDLLCLAYTDNNLGEWDSFALVHYNIDKPSENGAILQTST